MANQPDAGRIHTGKSVVRVKMKPGLEDSRIDELMRAGIGVLDFDAGASVRSEAASNESKGGARRSFNSFIEFTRDGGYGVLTNEGHDLTVVGFVEGPCAMFIDEKYENRVITEKAFQFDRYSVIEESRSVAPELYDVLRNYDALQTMSNVTDDDNKQIIYNKFHEAEEQGDIRQSPNSPE